MRSCGSVYDRKNEEFGMKVTEDLLKDALRYGKAFTKFGKTAQYIPELRAVNQYYLGVCTIDL